jgi:preprotein translocase subunit YajC
MDQWMLVGMIVLIVGMFGFQIISGRKKNKKREELLNSMGPGTRILTAGGMYGTIKSVLPEGKVVIDVGTPENETLIVLNRQGIRNIESGYAANMTTKKPEEEKKTEAKEDAK